MFLCFFIIFGCLLEKNKRVGVGEVNWKKGKGGGRWYCIQCYRWKRMEADLLKATMNEIYAVFFAASESINFYGTFRSLFMIFLNAGEGGGALYAFFFSFRFSFLLWQLEVFSIFALQVDRWGILSYKNHLHPPPFSYALYNLWFW